ncbi:MAG TPA: homoserine dehydrogenase [Pelagibacteraceae bacterium]|jgi:homoserine dehydrogenase|nr:homoserine dehydrogenase [Pelagibacteraceae bacterium]
MKLEKINIAIVGFGNIGSFFYKTLEKNKKKITIKTGKIPFVKYISAKNINKKRSIKIPKSKWICNPMYLATKKDIDVIIELVGGSDGIAKKIVFSALKNKKHVITANKALMSKYGDQLALIAEKNKVNLEYEASVAAGVPVIKLIKEGLIANKINKIYGILNGTTNYILSRMDDTGKNFSEVLDDAKKLGFAENNPASDVEGNDAAAKIKILSSIAFNKTISKNKILTEGIQNLNQTDIYHAKNLGYKIKLLAIAEIKNNKLMERVHPCLVLENSYIANINGVLNAIVVDGFPIGRSVLQGEGAGAGPTTSALISDLCSILRGNIKYPFGVSSLLRKKIGKLNILNHTCSSYLRIEAKDQPGVLSSITKIFAKSKISIKNLVQVPDKKKKKATIIIITHKTLEKNFYNLLSNLDKNKFVIKKPIFIRIEKI